MTLTTREALAHYQTHPAHIAYKSEVLAPFMEDAMAMDFEDAAL